MHNNLIPADLAEVIAIHRDIFGGFTMQAEPGIGDPAGQNPPADNAPEVDDFKSEASKQAVLADLRKERTERQALAAKVSELEPLKEQLGRLQEVFGGKPDDKAGGEDAIAAITRRLDESDRRADVERLARVNRITEDNDVALLMGVTDKAQREALAKRLAPAEDDGKDVRRLPRPDPSQGRSGGDRRPGSVRQAMEDHVATRHPNKIN